MSVAPADPAPAAAARILADLYLRELWSLASLTRQAGALRRAGFRDEALAMHLGRAERRREGLRELLETLGRGRPPRLVEGVFRTGGAAAGTLTGWGRPDRVLRAMDSAARALAARYQRAVSAPMPPEVVWRVGGYYRDVMLTLRWVEERIIFPDPKASPLRPPPGASPP